MTIKKEFSDKSSVLNTILLSISTPLIVWMAIQINDIQKFVSKTEQIDLRQDKEITQNRERIGLNESENKRQKEDIIYLNAILPEALRKKR